MEKWRKGQKKKKIRGVNHLKNFICIKVSLKGADLLKH